jgi:hypothetical protein
MDIGILLGALAPRFFLTRHDTKSIHAGYDDEGATTVIDA